jgi:hypothetical protein
MSINDFTPLVVSVVGGFAGLGALIKVYFDARAGRPDTIKKYIEIATLQADQIGDLLVRVATLEQRSNESESYIIILLDGIKLLIKQLEEAHITPRWSPPTRKRRTEDKRKENDG